MESLAGGNRVLHYLAVINAARDFGLSQADIEAVIGGFAPREPRSAELADALADLVLARTRL